MVLPLDEGGHEVVIGQGRGGRRTAVMLLPPLPHVPVAAAAAAAAAARRRGLAAAAPAVHVGERAGGGATRAEPAQVPPGQRGLVGQGQQRVPPVAAAAAAGGRLVGGAAAAVDDVPLLVHVGEGGGRGEGREGVEGAAAVIGTGEEWRGREREREE